MTDTLYAVADKVLGGETISRDVCRHILTSPQEDILDVMSAAFKIRKHHHGLRVQIHVLENAKMGACPEDCSFCSQSSKFQSPGGEAPLLTVEELVQGAKRAVDAKAKRYCMVTATRGPSSKDLDVICQAAKDIKSKYNVELCASLGLLNERKAKRLAEAGIDRFNHNLETSEKHFETIVSTHSWAERVKTIECAKNAGMETCVGGIIGLGESHEDIIDLAFELKRLDVDSIPVNFLDPRPGTPLSVKKRRTPQDALRALAMFRFVHPRADLRVAGGREVTLKTMQPMALYAANSLFTEGYLTTAGNKTSMDHQMIKDLGFTFEYANQGSDAAVMASLSSNKQSENHAHQ